MIVVEVLCVLFGVVIVFLVLYFLFLWISWLLAVWMTEPKRVQPAGTA